MINTKMITGLLILLTCLCLSACQSGSEKNAAVKQSADLANPGIGQLKTKDKLITIRTGHDGPLYSVKSNDGKVLAVDITSSELSAEFPELKEVVERSLADWAGLDQKYRQGPNQIDGESSVHYETKTIIMEHNQQVDGTRP
jgi:hypothetical protein